jgi:uncharacterized protein YjbJ (UPF0337 family)
VRAGKFGRPRDLAAIKLPILAMVRRSQMKDSTKDKAQGGAHELKGAAKQKIGEAVNNPDLEAEGAGEKLGGKIQKKIGDIEKVAEK